ncbi:hypothetical protein PsorP6_012760 [Peronosclerospora sorghi]|uniref:Uncharacterized protein n=1 Tax=Peronosclerospora sorghi TaxID=230839 RepID=A0ACC0WIQ8_9STRA|nr:hypothetical protein PsorP6_012760 [Peronosclerospora sorghi]
MDVLMSHAASVTFSTSSTPNCFVWEAAIGSCKFLHAFLGNFTALVDAHDEFQTQRLVPLIVATDLSAHFRETKDPRPPTCPADVACGQYGPVVLIGNYFFDSLPLDVFPVVREEEDRVVVYEALVEQETLRLADLDLVLSPVREARTQYMYQDARVNATLRQVLDDFQSTDEMSGLILFPVDAIALFLTLFDPPDASTAFPIVVLVGDAKHSFRDAISSAFVDWKNAPPRIHLSQLSPHPGCFCLPVDFAIFQLFFDLVDHTSLIYSGRSHLVTAPANDTFDVFYAILEPQSPLSTTSNTTLVASFAHRFAWLTASDYDLVWGMMSCDDAASCFSIDALLGLLAQITWDFDLFAVVMWELLRRWRCQETNATSELYRNLLIEAGGKSWRTFFPMENTVHLLHRLQVARWFYALEAYENVLALFTCWQDHTPPSITSSEVAVYYLLGLTSLCNNQPWQALSFFACVLVAPPQRSSINARLLAP